MTACCVPAILLNAPRELAGNSIVRGLLAQDQSSNLDLGCRDSSATNSLSKGSWSPQDPWYSDGAPPGHLIPVGAVAYLTSPFLQPLPYWLTVVYIRALYRGDQMENERACGLFGNGFRLTGSSRALAQPPQGFDCPVCVFCPVWNWIDSSLCVLTFASP